MLEDIIDQETAERRISVLSDEDRKIYKLYYMDNHTQVEIAKKLGKTQGYVAKHLVKIDDALSGFVESHEARAMCSEKRLRADDDEGVQ